MNEELEMAPPLMSQEEIGSLLKKHKPSRQKSLQEYEIILRFLSKGMVIHVGCQQLAFSDVNEGIAELNKYLESPYDEQQRWLQLLK